MLSSVRRRAAQSLTIFEYRATPGPSTLGGLARVSPCSVQQTRGVRTKGGTDFYTNANRQDERLLKKLEAQLARAQAKIQREEEEAAEIMKRQKYHGSPTASGNKTVENHNFYFWEKVLARDDRELLQKHGIRSIDELYTVYETAEAVLTRPPNPPIESLEPRLQVAHKMYASLPEKLAQAGRAKARSPFSGWF